MKDKKSLILAALSYLVLAAACSEGPADNETVKEDDTPTGETPTEVTHADNYEAKCYLRDVYMVHDSKNLKEFTGYYYWTDEIKEAALGLDLDEYDIYTCFDKMLNNPTDRWSWMVDAESYLENESGEYKGIWGVSFSQAVDDYDDYSLHVIQVFPSSPFARYGVTRGAKLLKMGDLDISDGFKTQSEIDYYNNHIYDSPQTFSMRLVDGRDTTFTIELPYSLSFNYITASKVFTQDDYPGLTKPVGYLCYDQFEANFVSDLDTAFARFKDAGVKKLILDLRYNGGGNSVASDRLISYLAPSGLVGKPYVTRTHNSYLSSNDETSYIGLQSGRSYSDISIGLEDIYFIMTRSSASASEMVYNGLRPYMTEGVNLHLVGEQSYGKPNGMYVLFYPGTNAAYARYDKGDYSKLEWVFYPICFYNKNANGQTIPAGSTSGTGFVPEKEYPDDIYHDFGPEEENIGACLRHIVSGEFPDAYWNTSRGSSTKATSPGIINRALLPEADTNPRYGRCVVRKKTSEGTSE